MRVVGNKEVEGSKVMAMATRVAGERMAMAMKRVIYEDKGSSQGRGEWPGWQERW
jgi:hypothetical protein